MKKLIDECTTEKHGERVGARSASRVALVVGLGLLLVLFLEAQAVAAGVATGAWSWSDFSGYFQWVGGFTASTLVPYAAKHWRAVGRVLSPEDDR